MPSTMGWVRVRRSTPFLGWPEKTALNSSSRPMAAFSPGFDSLDVHLHRLSFGDHSTQAAQRRAGEAADVCLSADRAADLVQLGPHLGVDCLQQLVLCEEGAALLLALDGGVPLKVDGLVDRLEEIEVQLVSRVLTNQKALEDGLLDDAGVHRHGHRDAELLVDGLVLAQQHLHDDAVYRVVLAVEGERADLVGRLSVAIDSALALLVARRVPGQVVVHDGVEILLQVDALAQAVGADQHALFVLAQLLRLCSSRSFGTIRPVTASTTTPSRSSFLRRKSVTYSTVGMKRQKMIGE